MVGRTYAVQNRPVADSAREDGAEDFGPAVAAWERAGEIPLVVLALLFLVVYSYNVLDTHLSSGLHRSFVALDFAIWALFGLDLVVRVVLAQDRLRYLRTHLVDVVVVALPVLRPLRAVRLVLYLRILHRRVSGSLRGRVVYFIAGSAVLLVYVAALAVLDAERGHPGANIETFGQALWWAVSTVSTVGYGDYRPVTTEGRIVAVGLMIGGVALIGAVAAWIASWLLEQVRAAEEQVEAATRVDIEAVRLQLDRIEARLAERPRSDPPPPPP